MQSEQLIESLLEQTQQINNRIEQLKKADIHDLIWREHATAWSILECIEHLNRYGAYYLPQIAEQIKKTRFKNDAVFKSGLLGNYFSKSMLPRDKQNKMKTFKDKNPLHAKLDKTVIDSFLDKQSTLAELLQQSRSVSLNRVKIKTSISGFLKLKLGDTFTFYIHHIHRHLKQIERIENTQKTNP